MSLGQRQPILILGAGINGAAIARELLLNRVSVVLVDSADVASGATAYSSRLIHGGLRYLEYGEFDLVRESLAERTRLLRLAPQFVQPLELYIPIGNRFRGLPSAAARFLGWRHWPTKSQLKGGRGLALVRAGLRFYDAYARDPMLPRHRVLAVDSPGALPVDRSKYRWECAYSDAQITFPERFVIALLEDCRQIAAAYGTSFELLTYHDSRRAGNTVTLHDTVETSATRSIAPIAIVNATGAWVDHTLARLNVSSRRLIGGTKGSHLLTSHTDLRAILGGRGVYAEAGDGRPVFIIPLADMTLVGTTDEPFDERPEQAIATGEEIDYLVDAVRGIFPQLAFQRSDVDFHYSGVRPLPFVDASTPGAITRRHWIERIDSDLPMYCIIGGKLTTCRSLAEETTATVLDDLKLPVMGSSRERPIPGSENYPTQAVDVEAVQRSLAEQISITLPVIRNIWRLLGTRTESALASIFPDTRLLPNVELPVGLADWMIEHESVRTLNDLVERRLMLLYDQRLSIATLTCLAQSLVQAGHLRQDQVSPAVEATTQRLQSHFGKRVLQQ